MKRIAALATLLAVLGATAITQAQDFSWNQTAAGLWSLNTNWTPTSPVGGPDAAGLFVLINTNITAGRIITLFNTGDPGDATKTVGRLDIGDTNGSSSFTIAAGTGNGVLDFNGNGGPAQLNQLSTSAGDTISAGVSLTSNLGVTNSSANALTISGVVGGAGGISVSAGALTLTAVNTYAGNTTISSTGRINLDGDSTLGNGAGTLTLAGGTLNTSASRGVTTDPVANNINLTGDSAITTTSTAATVTLNLTGTLTGSAGTLTIRNDAASGVGLFDVRSSGGTFIMNRPIVVDNGAGTSTTRLGDFNASGTTHTYNGVISGNGSFARTGNGGTTIFAANNTYTGSTSVLVGTLQLGNGGTTGALSPGSTITITLLGTLAINRSDAVTQGVDFSGAAISGSGQFVQAGTGSTTLNVANTYGGGTTISGGTLISAANGALGNGNVSLTAGAVILTLQGAGNNIADTATLNIGFANDVVNLNYAGTDAISSLVINGASQGAGVYGSAASGAPNVRAQLFGTGTLTVVPEPGTYMLLGLGVLVCGRQLMRRKKA